MLIIQITKDHGYISRALDNIINLEYKRSLSYLIPYFLADNFCCSLRF